MITITNLFEILWYLILSIAVHHSLKTNGKTYTITFFVPLFFMVFLIEELSVSVFKGFYYPNYNIYLLHIPISILFGWCAIVYATHHASKNILNRTQSILYLSLLAAIIGIAIDLLLEPLAYFFDFWIWNHPDVYFNASVENFISWFLIIFAFTAVFDRTNRMIIGIERKLLVLHISSAGIAAILILVILIWKSTINL